MKAYIQRIKLDGLIRAGLNCEKYLDPYEQISAFRELPNGAIEIVGLCTKCPHCGKGSLRPQHVKATNRAFRDLGFSVEWDRANHKPRRVKMPKEKIANVSEIFSGGKLNHGKFHSSFAHALKQINDGHYEIENGIASQSEVSPGRVRVNISFDRVEK
jgi:hypothetical protein